MFVFIRYVTFYVNTQRVIKMLKSSELAERLGLSKQTVIGLANDGKIPAIRLPSGHYRFDEKEVIAALRKEAGDDA